MTPFATGYTEATLAELNGRRIRATNGGLDPYTIDDLAPATLSRIIEDCERYHEAWPRRQERGQSGRDFWADRQNGYLRAFPPLIPYLGDDGLIYLREAGQ